MTLTGRIGDHYEIVTLLGSGAMGEVYRAIDRKMFDRTVAIKVLSERLTENTEGRARFRREMETSAKLHHPNIVTIHDWGEHGGRDFFVMEFVDGRDLQGLLKAGLAWDLERRLDVAFQVADALDFAHRAGVIHRDIKPGNVMVALPETGPRVKLVDFGIAHVERSSLTQMQSHPGTFSYMSPEQLRNEPLDPRSDLFSLGIVFCELFSGHHPFAAKSEALISSRVLHDDPEPPSRHGAEIPPPLEALLLRMLEKDPSARPASAREVADTLRELSRKAVARSASTDPTFTALDDLERQLVESLVSWARQKEAQGALDDALAAYEKAARLAPDSERIKRKIPDLAHRVEKQRELENEIREAERHLEAGRPPQAREALRLARILAPHDPRIPDLESRIEEAEAVPPELRERQAFVEPRMKEVDAALDAGKINEALAHLSGILRKYPDHTDAALLLDRLMEVAAGGVPYGEYRAALRNGRTALADGDLETAAAACARARSLWPDGPEGPALEAEIASAREEARRRDEEREAARLQDEAEKARREKELLERYLEGAKGLLAEARAIEPVSPGETRRALDAFGKTAKALELLLADRPDHTAAGETRKQVLTEIAALEKALAGQEAAAAPPPAPEPVPVPKPAPEPPPPRPEPPRRTRPPKRAPERREEPAPPRRRSRVPLALGGVAVLAAIAVGAFVMFRGGEEEAAPPAPVAAPVPAPAPGSVTVHAAPWGTLDRVVDLETGEEIPEATGRPTPLTIELPPGRYRAEIRNDAFGSPVEIEFEVRSGQAGRATGSFPDFDENDLLADLESAAGAPAGRARTR